MKFKLAKKWLILIISVVSAIVLGVVGLVVANFVTKNKNQVPKVKDTDWELATTFPAFYMGDEIDTNGLYFTRTKDGVVYRENVVPDMVVLPESGVDSKSGLNANGVFLESGSKTVTLLAFGKTFEVGVTVFDDYIVELFFDAREVRIVENTTPEQVAKRLVVYAHKNSGRIVQLDPKYVKIVAAFSGSDGSDSVINDGKFVKTNTTVFAQSISLEIEYVFVEGENLPTHSNEDVSVVFSNVKLTDSNIASIVVDFEEAEIFESVASRSDLVGVLPECGKAVFEDGKQITLKFSDGEYLFDIVVLGDGRKGYAFVLDHNGNKMLYASNSRKDAYVVSVGKTALTMEMFRPFGTGYAVVGDVPAGATIIGTDSSTGVERKVFVPSGESNLVLFEGKSYALTAKMEYFTRTGESYVLAAATSGLTCAEADQSAQKIEPDRTARDFYAVCTSVIGQKYVHQYITTESFAEAFGNEALVTCWFNNYGFADESRVFYNAADGYYYSDEAFAGGTRLDIANVTQVDAVVRNGRIVAFRVRMVYRSTLNVARASQKSSVLLCDGTTADVYYLSIIVNGFVSKITAGGSVVREAAGQLNILENKVVGVEQVEAGGSYFVGSKIDFVGCAFELTLASGEKLVLGKGRTFVAFGQTRTWSEADFEIETSNAVYEVLESGAKSYFAAKSGNHSVGLVYVGALSDGRVAKTTSDIVFVPDKIVNIEFEGNKTYFVGDDALVSVAALLTKNVVSVELQSGRVFDKSDIAFVLEPQFATGKLFVVLDASLESGKKNQVVAGLSCFETASTAGDVTNVDLVVFVARAGSAREDGSRNDKYFGGLEFGSIASFAGDKLSIDDDIVTEILNAFGGDTVCEIVFEDGTTFSCSLSQLLEKTLTQLVNDNIGVARIGFGGVADGDDTYSVWGLVRFELSKNSAAEVGLEFDQLSEKRYADGHAVGASDFLGAKLVVLTQSGRTLEGPTFENLQFVLDHLKIEEVMAPISSELAFKSISFVYSNGADYLKFDDLVPFFAKKNSVTQVELVSDILSETYLNGLEELADAAVYRRQAEFLSLKKYIESARLFENAALRMRAISGLEVSAVYSAVPVLKDESGHYVLLDGRKFYVEEDFLVENENGVFARVVVGAYQLFVKLNPNFDKFEVESETNRKYCDLVPFTFVIEYEGGKEENVLLADLAQRMIEIGVNHEYVSVAVTMDDGVGRVVSDKLTIRFVDVPVVENVVFDGGSLVEGQVVSLDQKMILPDGYYKTFEFLGLEFEYVLDGQKRTVNMANLSFVDFASSGVVGEISYEKLSDRAILVGDCAGKNVIVIRFVYAGVEFVVESNVVCDFAVENNYQAVWALRNQDILSGVLERSFENIKMASGKTVAKVDFDKNGEAEGYRLALVVKANEKYHVFEASKFDFGKLAGKTIAANEFGWQRRLFYASNLFVRYYLMVVPENSATEQGQSAVCEVVDGTTTLLGNQQVVLNVVELDFDPVIDVDMENAKTTCLIANELLGVGDKPSLEGIVLKFATGIEFALLGNDDQIYVVLRGNEVLMDRTLLADDLVLAVYAVGQHDGNVVSVSAKMQGAAVDFNEFVPPVAGKYVFDLTFICGGQIVETSLEIEFVEAKATSCTIEYTSDAPTAFEVGMVISISDFAKWVKKATILLENGQTVELSADQVAMLSFAEGEHYEVVSGGAGIKIGSGFALTDIAVSV